MSVDPVLKLQRQGAVLVATLHRPDKGNALDSALMDALSELAATLEQPSAGADTVRALVITGAGDRAFSAGADIADLVDLSSAQARAQMCRGQTVFNRIERLPLVVIAAINGFALGGGLELAMAADIRLAAPTARLGQPEITLANLPGWGGTQRLPRLIGRGRALELIFTGELISAQRAYDIGLVNKVEDDCLGAATELAQHIAARSAVAVAGAKRAVHTGLEDGITAGLAAEADAVAACCETAAQRQAVQAFINRKDGPRDKTGG